MKKLQEISIPALEIRQNSEKLLYSFAIDAKIIPSFATVSRIARDHDNRIHGYQRPEVLSHITEIRNYIESENAMIPNSIIVAFDDRVSFTPSASEADGPEYVRAGMLTIPVDETLPDNQKPGWIVDGQQRMAAIRDAAVERFPLAVTAFITKELDEQREQFILVNSTKPLPKGLIYELLPLTHGKLSSALERRRFPSYLLDRLNHDSDSPLRGKIKTPTVPAGLIQDNSILKMLENSLTDGILYRFRSRVAETEDAEPMLAVVKSFWTAAAKVFSDAWNLPPRKSRLTHGAGITSMGYVMDAISDRYGIRTVPSEVQFSSDLKPLQDVCRWTHGYWDFGPGNQRKWNEVQNTSKDIQFLSNYLLVKYRELVWNRT